MGYTKGVYRSLLASAILTVVQPSLTCRGEICAYTCQREGARTGVWDQELGDCACSVQTTFFRDLKKERYGIPSYARKPRNVDPAEDEEAHYGWSAGGR